MPTSDRPCLRAPSVPFRRGTVKGSSVPSVPPIGGHSEGHGYTIPRQGVRAGVEGTAGDDEPKAEQAAAKPKARARSVTVESLLDFERLKDTRPGGRGHG